jgi:hypothetical protein
MSVCSVVGGDNLGHWQKIVLCKMYAHKRNNPAIEVGRTQRRKREK